MFTTNIRTGWTKQIVVQNNHVLTAISYFDKIMATDNKGHQCRFHPSYSQNEHYDTAGESVESTKRSKSAKIGCWYRYYKTLASVI